MNDENEKSQFQSAALKFLFELELLDNPNLINNLKLNIFDASKFKVRDVELIMSQPERKMLIWIELSWFNRKFFKDRVILQIQERIIQLLPGFSFRVTIDKSILELALEKYKQQEAL